MRNIIILVLFFLILIIASFLSACDDFFSPTIEIFNDVKQNYEWKNEEIKN